MYRILVPAVAALGLVAFGAQTRTPVDNSLTEPAAMEWLRSQEGQTAKLAYGVANSDHLALMLTCEPGQSSATVYGDLKPVGAGLVPTATSLTEIDPLSGEGAPDTHIALRDPALQDLARRGVLNVEGDSGRFRISASRSERQVVAGFFAYCSSARV
ncbi:hypothetical protein [uncultured Brevundimonas sp.]|uniref:hypothetical protein n=1 Tax=uncultured Brevundimonas sp. TaxID=213418 RepID=UPI0030EC556A|tara:strand:+ start:32045 stop:32515 length:471 start_codon:yes stop_codon:yes gene_type:complete